MWWERLKKYTGNDTKLLRVFEKIDNSTYYYSEVLNLKFNNSIQNLKYM